MINAKQLKSVAAFAKKSVGACIKINFDKKEIEAVCNNAAVQVRDVEGLEGEGLTTVPMEVVCAAVTLLGSDGLVSATNEEFCSIPFKPLPPELLARAGVNNEIFAPIDFALPGRPGLYHPDEMNLLMRLSNAFRSRGEFRLPISPEMPLVYLLTDCSRRSSKEIEPIEETVRAAIAPFHFDLINTFEGVLPSPQKEK